MSEQLAPLRRVGGLGVAATILIGVVAAMEVVSTWATWNGYWVVQDYMAGTATEADLRSADSTISIVSALYLFAFAASAIVFVVWLWRARVNAELLCSAPHRRGRAWGIGLTPDSLRRAGVVELLLSAATIIPVVRQINTWQDGRVSQAA